MSHLFARKKLWLWFVLKWPCAVEEVYKSKKNLNMCNGPVLIWWLKWVYTESAWESHIVLLYEWLQNYFKTKEPIGRERCKIFLWTPHDYNFGAARAGWAERPETTAGWVTTAQTAADNPDDDGQPPTPGTTTDDPASHQHHRRPRLATNTTDVAVQLTTPASHQHHRRPRLATITTDDPG